MLSQPHSIPARRWTSVFVRWHLRHAAIVSVVVRLLLSMALAWILFMSDAAPDTSVFYGADTALLAVTLTVAVATLDRKRIGANDLMANLGYSRSVQVVMTAIPALLLELVINVAVLSA
jgi:F0F1-type ATP synthase assembly protein I